MLLRKKKAQTIKEEFSNILTTSKENPNKTGSDRGKNFHDSFFQKLLKLKSVHLNSKFAYKRPSIPQRVIRMIYNLLKKATVSSRIQ